MGDTKYSRLAGEESGGEDAPKILQRGVLPKPRIARYAGTILFGAVALALGSILGYVAGQIRSRPGEPVGYSIFPSVLRQPPGILKVFGPDPAFAGYSNESDIAWNALMPKGRGYVGIQEPSAAGLKPGVPVQDSVEKYALSAFHQLHCLAMLRQAYYRLRESAEADEAAGEHAHSRSAGAHAHHQDTVHLDHCFDYIRQAIMCAADRALEPARVEVDGSRFQVDGWGGEHQCRSWEALVEYAEGNRVSDEDYLVLPE